LGKTEIKADVIDVDPTTAHLMTLGENIARTPVQAIEFARTLKEMFDSGTSVKELSAITGRKEPYIHKYISLVERGEERLIKGVEEGLFPLSFATEVADSDDRSIQHLLMDAYDHGIVNTSNLSLVRRVIEDRKNKGKALGGTKKDKEPLTVNKLKNEIRQVTKEKEAFVFEANRKENRLMSLLVAIRKLRQDSGFMALLDAEGLSEEPALKGNYLI
jgi:ParB family chromosome partitioning protein